MIWREVNFLDESQYYKGLMSWVSRKIFG